jgi:hypothetical protein
MAWKYDTVLTMKERFGHPPSRPFLFPSCRHRLYCSTMNTPNYLYDEYKQWLDNWQASLRAEDAHRLAYSSNRINFFDKLTVLASGTIAIIATLAGAAVSARLGPVLHQGIPRALLFVSLTSVLLALFLAIAHNRLELNADKKDYIRKTMDQQAASWRIAYVMDQSDATIRNYHERKVEAEASARTATRTRAVGDKIGYGAIATLFIGYVALTTWVLWMVLQ